MEFSLAYATKQNNIEPSKCFCVDNGPNEPNELIVAKCT